MELSGVDNRLRHLRIILFTTGITLLTSCSHAVDRAILIGEWVHTNQQEIPDNREGEYRTGLRRDLLILEEDGNYQRLLTSSIPGEEDLDWKGHWSLRHGVLTLQFTRQDGTLGKAKGKVRIIQEGISITVDGRFYVKRKNPETKQPVHVTLSLP